MSDLGKVDRNQLLQWADSIQARSEFPRLVRRLVAETGQGVVQLGFPAAEGVSVGGWDGSVRATEASPYVPEGMSVWELSVQKSTGTKADSDYEKRTETPDGSATGECTYVAVLLRPWTKREEWGREKSKDGRWAEVRALGVDDIEAWLEQAPVTRAWFLDLIGLEPYGYRSADAWWEGWSRSTKPALSAELVLAGRQPVIDSLEAILDGEPGITTIKAASVEDAQAFLAAFAVVQREKGNDRVIAGLAFVDFPTSWRALHGQQQPLILVPTEPSLRTEIAGSASSHHVLVPVVESPSSDLELPLIDPELAQPLLTKAGIEESKSYDLSRLARRSLLALRRRLAITPGLHVPPWAHPPTTPATRAGLLAGRWHGGLDGDIDVVEELAGIGGEELREAFDRLASEEDPLLGRLEQSWALTSPYDAWLQLADQLQENDLKRLDKAVETVLLERDPTLEFPPEEQWKASYEGLKSSYSSSLKRGLSETLALLAINGDNVAGGKGASLASYFAAKILGQANEDESGQIWSTLAPQLPLFAEAAPDAFLDAVRDGVSGQTPVLRKLFTDEKGKSALFTAGSPHTHLLWAFEALAWSVEHLGQVVDLLAGFAEIDPGGELSNRPGESLAKIFCPWYPENAADNGQRLDIIDGLRGRHEAVAWKLMLSMLPDLHGTHFPTSEPRLREWKPPRSEIPTGREPVLINGVVERLVADAGTDPARWATLIERGSDLPPEGWQMIREGLSACLDAIPEEQRPELWTALRAFVAKHREFSETAWALPEAEVVHLEALLDRLAPQDAIEAHAWLFVEGHPDLGSARYSDFERYERELEEHRVAAVEKVAVQSGLDGLLQLAVRAEIPRTIGWSLAGSQIAGEHEQELLGLLQTESGAVKEVAAAYFGRRFTDGGWEWFEALLEANPDFPSEIVGGLLLESRDLPKAWEVAEAQGSEIETAYWAGFGPFGLGPNFEHVHFVARKLFDADRPLVALRLLEIYMRKELEDPAEHAALLVEALQRILEIGVDGQLSNLEGLSQYDFQRVFEYLEKQRDSIGHETLGRLEWSYMAALGYDPKVPTLHEAVASDPEFFVQIVSAIYKPHSAEDPPEPSEEERNIAGNGYRLLSSWSVLPGTGQDGQIDGDGLADWVDRALHLLEQADRLEVGETHIGHVLAFAPWDEEDRWPVLGVRELLERLQRPRIEEGLRIQIYNNRGVTSRSPSAGGEQERELAERYEVWERAFRDRWPRIAAVLRSLAAGYREEAQRHDAEAERRRLGLDL